MRLLLSFILLLASPTPWAMAKIDHWQTKQGGNVYFVRTQGLPLADIRVTFDAGSARDGQQQGVAALTATLLEKGAADWDANALAERFESVGAIFNASSAIDTATLSLRTLTDPPLFDKALSTMQAVLAKPRFDQADVLREKNRTLAAIKQQAESPAETAAIAFYQALYGQHPYGHPRLGSQATVAALTADDLRRFHQRHYVAANAQVVIVGDLDRQQAAQTAETLLGGLAVGQKPAPLPAVAAPESARATHLPFPSSQTHVLVGMPGIASNDPDYFSLYVGNHILGGSGLVSKLFNEVRERRGLAYGVSSAIIPMAQPGPFLVRLQTRNDQAGQALAVVNDVLAEFVSRGPDAQEVAAAQKHITGGFAMRFDTNRELAGLVSMMGFYGLPLDYLQTFQDNINRVTAASVADAFRRRLPLARLQTVTVGQGGQ